MRSINRCEQRRLVCLFESSLWMLNWSWKLVKVSQRLLNAYRTTGSSILTKIHCIHDVTVSIKPHPVVNWSILRVSNNLLEHGTIWAKQNLSRNCGTGSLCPAIMDLVVQVLMPAETPTWPRLTLASFCLVHSRLWRGWTPLNGTAPCGYQNWERTDDRWSARIAYWITDILRSTSVFFTHPPPGALTFWMRLKMSCPVENG